MDEVAAAPAASSSAPANRNRQRRPNPSDPNSSHKPEREPNPSGRGTGNPRGRGRGGNPRGRPQPTGGDTPDRSLSRDIANPSPTGNSRPRRRNPKPPISTNASIEAPQPSQDGPPNPANPKRRRNPPKFDASLTNPQAAAKQPREQHESNQSDKYRVPIQKDDLTSRLIHEIRTHPYPDCAICFNSIHPAQPTWSCSPTSSVALSAQNADASADTETAQCCWITFHLKCVRSWASKSVKEVADALRARGEEASESAWLCPACRTKRASVPSGYKCFCGSTIDPKPPRLATPHSCGSPCSRSRTCGHPCPIPCHPGPCPPCQVTTQLRCHCSRKVLSFKCSSLSPAKNNGVIPADLSCGGICFKELGCKNHACQTVCHPGSCNPCEVQEEAQCYCGKEKAIIGCGKGIPEDCEVQGEAKWTGAFQCVKPCARPLDCGIHNCTKPCHPPSAKPATCPRSPSVIDSCPCGKHQLVPTEAPFFPPSAKLIRTKCSDPIPLCTSICMKPLDSCSHVCSVPCHTGPCPSCIIKVVRPCRCGATNRDIQCYLHQAGTVGEILCDRTCPALRACGRHQCNRLCCPLASLASVTKGKGRRRANEGAIADEEGWHVCDLVCGKPLTCGNHQCEERDHKGPCPPCLRSSFEEMFCYCGKTMLEPPIPCGTQINCSYPCDRPPPPCGHPKAQHSCHEDPKNCPPCAFLTSKTCGCGKKSVDNIRCSQEKVSCGTSCRKLMRCGFHRCERSCHSDDCGPCETACGKSRKLCLPAHHPCEQKCHAPAVCPEVEPCRSIINLSCPCERIRQPVPCGRSTSHPSGREGSQQLKCTNDCGVAKRNARLAEALGISPENRADARKVIYTEEILAYARANSKFCSVVEKSLADFVNSDKKSQVLPHMPESRRQFVQELAGLYRTDTQVVDQEPHRSVQLIRRIDSRVPNPLLSSASSPSLGKLADLRAPWRPIPSPAASSAKPAAPSAAAPNRWTSIVSRPDKITPTLPTNTWANTGSNRSTTPLSETRAPTPRRETPVPTLVVPTIHNESVPDNWEEDT